MNQLPDNDETRALERYADEHAGDPTTFLELTANPDAVEDASRQRRVHNAMAAWHTDFAAFLKQIAQPPFDRP